VRIVRLRLVQSFIHLLHRYDQRNPQDFIAFLDSLLPPILASSVGIST
jgi:hypothetical protein